MSKFSDRATLLPSAKFPAIGSSVEGRVLSLATNPVPEFEKGRMVGTRELATGGKMTQLDVTLQTEDGKVVLHTKGGIFNAIDKALADAGLDDLLTGYTLKVEYAEDGEPGPEGNARKIYRATVTK
jgi:hypothetical protein